MTVKDLKRRGFDLSEHDGRSLRVRCSQCEVMVINGVACHERGCPNAVHVCAGCGEIIPANRKYCSMCG